ncbi:hypothetical protein LZ575_17280 [Antarcticibacterium sp. 1MA-6-2]|uniref:hypothetical protein n=1 Tax=Antarcticibacterium sp. 1MA-6-2 TaxID=2908210 RepID=UPI001F4727C5|nr:hypothetical protein [Antarcticibacterium sp. 1MA-6-2]UJH90531.1 hypothetical protein LZ575_17280 [Antarcticibacterium sp. 1MA-6-2]
MKRTFLSTVFALALLSGFTSCSSGDDDLAPVTDDVTGGIDGVLQGTVLTGNITEDLLVETGNYSLKGAVTVKNGATLTIEPGTTFTVTADDQAAGINLLFVEQGGKIMAEGTAAQPIVFTSKNKNAEGGDGDWGGIGIHGRATMNAPGGTSISEAGQLPYGGTNDNDNSGSLKFVRVEYAGQASSDGQFEFNAFSFFAVGSGTVLENLEAFEGADDGFEFYGGTVNAKNLSAIGMEDDSVDWDEGYRGTIDNVVIYQYDNVGDFAFELANRSGENNASPRSKATVKNITARGHNRSGKSAFDLKQGTGGIFDNLVVYNYETIIFLNNQLQEVENGNLKFSNANFDFSENLLVNNIDQTNVADLFISMNEDATGADLTAFEGWSNFDSKGGF